jgi:hypothetical protein
MSNLNNEVKYESITELLRFVFEQQFKGIYTTLPGIIKSYNPTTKRAAVQPALTRVLTNGEELPLPVVQNVPVCFPTGGGFSILFPVAVGDTCIMLFSQRGIDNFKVTFEQERPDEGLLDLNDAIAIMGFGPLTVTPASASGASLQSDDGANSIVVENGKITMTAENEIELNTPLLTVNATNSTFSGLVRVIGDLINGLITFSNHIHSQGNDSGNDAEVDTGAPHE